MNIFYLDSDPAACAQAHFDKHVVKMILESAQLLCTAHRVLDGEEKIELNRAGARMKRWYLGDERDEILYKATHYNHPSALWARANNENYLWLYQMWLELMKEYTYRYDKHHASERLIPWLSEIPVNIPVGYFFAVTPAMDKHLIIPGNSIESYRNYYITTKMPLYSYTRRTPPEWIVSAIDNLEI